MKKQTLTAALLVALLITALAGALTADVATANFTHPGCYQPAGYDYLYVSSPANKTYRTTRISLAFTHTTNFKPASWTHFYILDGDGSMRVDDARVDLKPVKETSRVLSSAKYKYPWTEYTLEFNISLPNLAEGSHTIIVGYAPPAGPGWTNPYISELTPNVYFSVELSPPQVSILSPVNETYEDGSVLLNFRIHEEASWLRWVGYSVDGKGNVSVSKDAMAQRFWKDQFLFWEGELPLSGLSAGTHSVAVYAENMDRQMGVASCVFTVGQQGGFTPEAFPAVIVTAAIIASAAAISFGLAAYLLKHKKKQTPQ